jgi:hypothetical protein
MYSRARQNMEDRNAAFSPQPCLASSGLLSSQHRQPLLRRRVLQLLHQSQCIPELQLVRTWKTETLPFSTTLPCELKKFYLLQMDFLKKLSAWQS